MPINYINDGIPDSLHMAMAASDAKYNSGEGVWKSVTGLIQPAQLAHLLKHNTVDWPSSTRLWALFGSAVHQYIETLDTGNVFKEARFRTEVAGKVISGQVDRLDPTHLIIEDYKVCSTWAVLNGNVKDEWVKQMNMYRYLAMANEFDDITALRIVAILKDWKGMLAKTQHGYPKLPVVSVEIPIMSTDMVRHYMEERISAHMRAERGEHVECTPDECWRRGDAYKIYKWTGTTRAKRAHKVFDGDKKAAAIKYAIDMNKRRSDADIKKGVEYAAIKVAGSNVRCEEWCPVASVCPQYQATLEKEEE